jgi:hypothetical protein
MEHTFTIAADGDLRSKGRHAALTRAMPVTLMSRIRAHSASSFSSTVPTALTPALLTRMSMRPKRSATASIAASTDARSATSATKPSRRSSSPSTAMSRTATADPRSARASAVARPIPEAPPVTTETRPANSVTRQP